MAMGGRGIFKLAGTIFTLVGLILLGVAGWTGNRQYTILKTWPSVEAEVVKSEVISYRVSDGDMMYKAAIDFRYTVDGKEYTVPSSSGYSSSSYSSMRSKVNAYAPGTRHPIRYNPSDPGDMRFDVGYNFGFFFVPFLLGVMGIVFTAFGVGSLYAARAVKPRLCPSCGQPVGKGQNFCPSCSAPLPSE